MKSLRITTVSFGILLIILVFAGTSSCNKEITNLEPLPPLTPAKIDENAGKWKTFLLTAPDEIAIPTPDSAGSASYIQECVQIKSLQGALTAENRQTIDRWSRGGTLLWNQLLRQLVARRNLPPAPESDGTYKFPNAANPFDYPQFPFANPPYAARAYSYVSAAQYDALVAAWHYKFLYKRISPSKADNTIQSLMPSSELPSYPSEDAVLAGVTEAMLRLLFPADTAEIAANAAAQCNAALWSGRANFSDIQAGKDLGKAVAAKFIARAKSDNMGKSVGTPAQWKALEDSAKAKGEIPWISRENPPRPPMLPFFGQVKTWIMTPADLVAERPAPPPPTASEQMKKETAEVKDYSENLTRERLAIVHKWADGVGTYTPPGHWDDIAADYIIAGKFSEIRAARVFAMVNIGLHEAAVGCWETKYFYFNPRPSQMDVSIKTGTGVPNFPSYTSGHSTFSGSAATILGYLFPEKSDYFMTEAQEASISRLYGAIHYRSDIEKGMDHGKKIGGYVVRWSQSDAAFQ